MRTWKITKSLLYTILLLSIGFFIQFKVDQFMSTVVVSESAGHCEALREVHNSTDEFRKMAYNGYLEYEALTHISLQDEECSYLVDTSDWSD